MAADKKSSVVRSLNKNNFSFNAVTEAEKLKKLSVTGCPVNKRTPTWITKKLFIKLCTLYQTRAGVFDKKKPTVSASTPGGWRTNNIVKCTNCETGVNVTEGRAWECPIGITIVAWEKLHEKIQSIRQRRERTDNERFSVNDREDSHSPCESDNTQEWRDLTKEFR